MGWLGYNERVRVSADVRHSVDRMLALLEGAGIEAVHDTRLYTSEDDRGCAQTLVGTERYAVVAPTSRWAGKRWAEDRFIDLVRALLKELERVVIVASPSEREQCPALFALAERDNRIVDLVGKTSIGELMAVIERASLVVANDSAPLHMAVGFDRPLVALFGPTRIDEVGPYRRDADVLQAQEPPAHVSHKHEDAGRALMDLISTESVIEACLSRLRSGVTS
jgi:heptosyltransferase-3